MTTPITYMSFCSGIEAATEAWRPLGWKPLAFSEIDPFPRAVLTQRFNAHDARCGLPAGTVPLFGDFTALRVRHFRRLGIALPDILIAGTPCQSFSQAGKRLGLNDPRGALSLQFLRTAHAIDNARHQAGLPGLVLVWENVPGCLNDRSNAFGAFLAGFLGDDQALPYPTDKLGQPTRWADAGLASGASAKCAWRLLDSQYFGVAQRRNRVIFVGCFRNRACPTEILFEHQSRQGHPTPLRKTRTAVGALTANGIGVCGPTEQQALSGHLIPVSVMAHGQGGAEITNDGTCPTLTCNHEAPITAFNCKQTELSAGPQSPPLRATGSRDDQDVSVRRITPTEYERLQGFSDGHTAVGWRGKDPVDCPDSHRYKAVGNSMAVPVIAWVGKRIQASIKKQEGLAA